MLVRVDNPYLCEFCRTCADVELNQGDPAERHLPESFFKIFACYCTNDQVWSQIVFLQQPTTLREIRDLRRHLLPQVLRARDRGDRFRPYIEDFEDRIPAERWGYDR